MALHVTYKGTFVLGRDEVFSQGAWGTQMEERGRGFLSAAGGAAPRPRLHGHRREMVTGMVTGTLVLVQRESGL